MELVRDLERRLEQLVESAGSVLGGHIHPAELPSRLAREADLGLRNGPAGVSAPNAYSVYLHPDDSEAFQTFEASRDLAHAVEAASIEQGWRLEGPVDVLLHPDASIPPGTVRCVAAFQPGRPGAWARLTSPALELLVRFNRSIVGRSRESDVVVPIPEVSRAHALLWREAGTAWIADLDSTNGTYLNGVEIQSPTTLTPGDTVTLGSASFTFDPL